MKKEAGMRIRVEQDLRDEFIAACKAQHTPASQILRQVMRTYVEQFKQNSKKINASSKNLKLSK
jgi:hypothetical protein